MRFFSRHFYRRGQGVSNSKDPNSNHLSSSMTTSESSASLSELSSSSPPEEEAQETTTSSVDLQTSSTDGAPTTETMMPQPQRRRLSLGSKIVRIRKKKKKNADANNNGRSSKPKRSGGARPRRTPLHVMCSPSDVVVYSAEALQTHLQRHPKDALAVDKRGMTPLHVLLSKLPHRNDLAELLIQAAPRAAVIADGSGRAPLHYAASHADKVSYEVLETLLKYDPSLVLDEDSDGDTPFGLYCDFLERTVRGAREDDDGAAEKKKTMKLSNVLIQENGGAESVARGDEEEYDEMDPSEIYAALLEKCVPLVRAVAWGDPTAVPVNNDEGDGEEGQNDQDIEMGMHMPQMAAEADNQDANDQDNENDPNHTVVVERTWDKMTLHSALYAVQRASASSEDMKGKFGVLLSEVLRRTARQEDADKEEEERRQQQEQEQQQDEEEGHQDDQQQDQPLLPRHEGAQQQNYCATVDERGNLPIHIAASIHSINAAPSLNNEGSRTGGFVDDLVRLYPDDARTCDPSGLLPLEIAKRGESTWRMGGMGAIVRAHPAALEGMGLENDGTVPQLLSRVGGKSATLGTMFEVLRQRPEVLANAKP